MSAARYEVLWWHVDPSLGAQPSILKLRKDYGSPISRARIYILLLRGELMTRRALSGYEAFASEICAKLQAQADVSWKLALNKIYRPRKLRKDLLLPRHHSVVAATIDARARRVKKAKYRFYQK